MQHDHSEYKNARMFDFNRWSEYREVNLLAEVLSQGIPSRKLSDYVVNMKVILLDLYHSHLTDPTQYVAYFRNNNHYTFKKRFKDGDRSVDNPLITYDYFVGAVNTLIANKYITSRDGFRFEPETEDDELQVEIAKMRATTKLVDTWWQYGWTPEMIGQKRPENDRPLLFLYVTKKEKRGKKTIKTREPVKVPNNHRTKRMSKIIHAYNEMLDRTHIDCDIACINNNDRKELIEKLEKYDDSKEPVIRLRLGDKHVYRVFSGGDTSLRLGGRFYGPFWVGCPSVMRKYITINGNPTIELDYKGIHIQLLYALRGINYAALKDDPYNLICKPPEKDPDRDFNKLILLTAINATKETKARDSVYKQMWKKDELEKYNLTDKAPIIKKLKQLKEKHAPIADDITSGKGLMLQYYDSCVIEQLMQYAARTNTPILTVHDSVICERHKADLILDKMWQYFTDLLIKEIGLKIDYKGYHPHAKWVFKYLLSKRTSVPVPRVTLPGLQRPIKAAPDSWLRQEELIVIDNKARSGACSGTCNHSKRVELFRTSKRRFPYTSVTVALVPQGRRSELYIRG